MSCEWHNECELWWHNIVNNATFTQLTTFVVSFTTHIRCVIHNSRLFSRALLQKRPIILRSLLIGSYKAHWDVCDVNSHSMCHSQHVCIYVFVCVHVSFSHCCDIHNSVSVIRNSQLMCELHTTHTDTTFTQLTHLTTTQQYLTTANMRICALQICGAHHIICEWILTSANEYCLFDRALLQKRPIIWRNTEGRSISW